MDCQATLIDHSPPPKPGKERPVYEERVPVFRSGRRIDAELVRGRLEANGLRAWVWGSGMGAYRMESALTEMTGVPNDFSSYQVVVDWDDVDEARELLDDAGEPPMVEPDLEETLMSLGWLRHRWLLFGFALFLLLIVVLIGAPGG